MSCLKMFLLIILLFSNDAVSNEEGENIQKISLSGEVYLKKGTFLKKNLERTEILLFRNGTEQEIKDYFAQSEAFRFRDSHGQNLLHLLIIYDRNPELLSFFIKKGISVDSIDIYGRAALHVAAVFGDAKAALTLIKAGAKLDIADRAGNTPLHLASRSAYNIEVINLLINKSADIFPRNKEGHTPLFIPQIRSKVSTEDEYKNKNMIERREGYKKVVDLYTREINKRGLSCSSVF